MKRFNLVGSALLFLACSPISRAGGIEVGPYGTIILTDGAVRLLVRFDQPASFVPRGAEELQQLLSNFPKLKVPETGSDDYLEQTKTHGIVGRDILNCLDLSINLRSRVHQFSIPQDENQQGKAIEYAIRDGAATPILVAKAETATRLYQMQYLTQAVSVKSPAISSHEHLYERARGVHGFSFKRQDGVDTWFEAIIDDDLPEEVDGDFGFDLIVDDVVKISFSKKKVHTYSHGEGKGVQQLLESLVKRKCNYESGSFWITIASSDGTRERAKVVSVDDYSLGDLMERYLTEGVRAFKGLLEKRPAKQIKVETSGGAVIEIPLT